MKPDHHETNRKIIDKSLAGRISPQEEDCLRQHLQACPECQEYLSASTRVIASLGGFSFDVSPDLQAKVRSSLELRSQELEAWQSSRRRMTLGGMTALVLIVAGSFAASQFGARIAPVLYLQPMQVQHILLAFWVVPSLCFFLLLTLLPLFFNVGTKRRGRIL